MGRLEVKKIIRRCVSNWSGKHAKQSDKLGSLRNVTAASKRQLANRINKHPDLKACASLIADSQIAASMRVTELGQRVWNNKQGCLVKLP